MHTLLFLKSKVIFEVAVRSHRRINGKKKQKLQQPVVGAHVTSCSVDGDEEENIAKKY